MIFVTGGTGLIGGEVLRLLSQDGVAARALVRNPQRAKDLPGITWVAGDMAKPETLPAAFQGAETLFLVSSIGEDNNFQCPDGLTPVAAASRHSC